MHRCEIFSRERLIIFAFILAGGWQFGTGTYIYAKAHLAQVLLGSAWSKTIQGQEKVKPWSWADTYPVAKINFNGFEKELIVLSGASGRTMAFGPGHVSTSPLPGENGNSVIAGHRDTHFSILKDLQIGSKIDVQMPDKQLYYQIVNHFIVDQSQVEVMNNQGVEILTLITCYPFNTPQAGGPLRYVIQALPI